MILSADGLFGYVRSVLPSRRALPLLSSVECLLECLEKFGANVQISQFPCNPYSYQEQCSCSGASDFLAQAVAFPIACCRNLDYEIVIIDDNSPDGTQEVVKRLQTAYSSEKIVRPE